MDLILLGLLPGTTQDEALRGMTRLFGMDGRQARDLLERCPVVIRSGISADEGKRYMEALKAEGLSAELEEKQSLLVIDQVQITSQDRTVDQALNVPAFAQGFWDWLIKPMLEAKTTTRQEYWGATLKALILGVVIGFGAMIVTDLIFSIIAEGNGRVHYRNLQWTTVRAAGHIGFYLVWLKVAGPAIVGSMRLHGWNESKVLMVIGVLLMVSSFSRDLSVAINLAMFVIYIHLGTGLPNKQS